MKLLFAAAAMVSQAAAAEVSACTHPLPPGYQVVTQGYDLSKMDFVTLATQSGATVLSSSCSGTATYVNDYTGQTYSVPDQLADAPVPVGGTVVTPDVSILATTSTDFNSQVATSFLGGGAQGGVFSNAAFSKSVAQNLVFNNVYAGIISSSFNSYKMDLASNVGLSTLAQSQVDALPAIFNDTTFAQYSNFFQVFGTHYLKSAVVGCRFQYQYFTGVNKSSTLTQDDVSGNANLAFGEFLVGAGVNTSAPETPSDDFTSTTTPTTTCFNGGGIACPTSASGFAAFSASCAAEPVLVSGTFAPISDLVSDANIKAQLSTAAHNHLSRAFIIDELPNTYADITTVLTTSTAINDNGGNCTPPANCVYEPNASPCPEMCCDNENHTTWDNRVLECHNPTWGEDLNTKVSAVNAAISALSQRADFAKGAAAAAVQNTNIVSTSTVQYLYNSYFAPDVAKVQTAVESAECGFVYDNMFWATTGCVPRPAQNITLRETSFLSGLAQ